MCVRMCMCVMGVALCVCLMGGVLCVCDFKNIHLQSSRNIQIIFR